MGSGTVAVAERSVRLFDAATSRSRLGAAIDRHASSHAAKPPEAFTKWMKPIDVCAEVSHRWAGPMTCGAGVRSGECVDERYVPRVCQRIEQ